MAKVRHHYVCQECGHTEPKWLGRCPGCGGWSTFVEGVAPARGARATGGAVAQSSGSSLSRAVPLIEVASAEDERRSTGLPELDRVLGGGLVPGSLILVGGDPGIGKSTLLLQALGKLTQQGVTSLYVTGEESAHQVKMRAQRLGVRSEHLYLLTETQLEAVERARAEITPQVCVVDSVQTIGTGELQSAVGSVAQIRAVTHALMQMAKSHGVATFVVGHVTKEGTIAGPKVMEHMVDTVLYFEGERSGPYRILRAHKNRFGSAQEIGVFEMHGAGLRGVSNPSELFLSQRATGPGAAVITSVEGSRPLLLEVQALATASPYGTPRRTTLGIDPARVSMLCAVLGARAGYELGGFDVYVNVAGGVKVSEPGADLGVILALASSVAGRAVPEDTVVVGEVGLSGEVRGVSSLQARVQEASALGFARCIVPQVDLDRWSGPASELPLVGVRTVQDALRVVDLGRE